MKKEQVHVYLSAGTAEALKHAAKAARKPISAWVEQAVEEKLGRDGLEARVAALESQLRATPPARAEGEEK